jgi:hypothetical protein
MDQSAQAGMGAGSGLVARPTAGLGVLVGTRHTFECFGADGTLKWREEVDNLVVTEGLNALITNTFKTIPGSVTWYVGLKLAGSVAAGDTMASHAGWLEAGIANAPTYSEAARPTTAWSAASAGAKALSAGLVFTFTGSGTVKGCFLNTVATKDGTTGVLLSAGLFTGGDQPVVSTNTLTVSYSLSL